MKQKFKYTALSADSKKLDGVIEATNENEARQELHKMNLSVITIQKIANEKFEKEQPQKISENKNKSESDNQKITPQKADQKKEVASLTIKKTEETIKQFYFKAIDTSGKEVDGVIDSQDDFSAYRRLIEEYSFDVKELFSDKLSATEKKAAQSAGVSRLARKLKVIQEQAKHSQKGIFSFLQSASPSEQLESEVEEEALLEEQSQKLQKAVDQILKMATEISDQHQSNLPNEFIDKLKTTIDRLAVLKMSNNFAHIRDMSLELIELINPKDPTHPLYKFKAPHPNEKDSVNEKEEKSLLTEFSQTTSTINSLTGKLESFLNGNDSNNQQAIALTEKNPTPKTIQSFWNKLRFKKYPPAVYELTKEKQEKMKQLIYLFKLYFTKKSASAKTTVKEELLTTWKKYKELRQKVKDQKFATKKDFSFILKDFRTAVSWLLAFYLLYFLFAQLIVQKNINFQVEFFWKTISSPLLLYILISLFVLEIALIVKIKYLKRNLWAGLFIFMFAFGLSGLIIINF